MPDKLFKPHRDFKKLYFSYLLIGSIVLYLSWIIPATILMYMFLDPVFTFNIISLISIPFLLIIFFTAFWIPKYHSSISYLLSESDIVIEKGVWWKRKSIVPYNRVTNIDIFQGPISRHFELGKISIQTAGFSGGGSSGSAKAAEAVILGIKNFEEIKNFILSRVKRVKPVAVEADSEPDTAEDVSGEMIAELRKIRKLLEEQSTT
ncbi:PH domain-containing protein [[Eubacterium] cellulosolvens]